MRLEEAEVLAQKVIEVLTPLCDRVEVAGSIRRKKPQVNDIDIVAIPRPKKGPRVSAFGPLAVYEVGDVWSRLMPEALAKEPLKLIRLQAGPELMRFTSDNGLQVDVYRARPETWGIMLLVRTGSKEHNVKLCILAHEKGMMLSAKEGVFKDGKVIASRTEEEIFAALELDYVEPRDREV